MNSIFFSLDNDPNWSLSYFSKRFDSWYINFF